MNFLNKNFTFLNLKTKDIDDKTYNIIIQRINEIQKSIENEIYLWSIFLIWSTLEGLLFDIAIKHSNKFCNSNSAPKDKNWNILQIQTRKLWNLIDVSYEIWLISLNSKKFSHSLRDFRNFIHPMEQVKYNFNPDIHTAKICLQVLKSVIDDINKNNL